MAKSSINVSATSAMVTTRLQAAMSQNVLARLRSAVPSFTPALSRIADYILSEPDQLLAQTITELAEQAGSSESSVIRLCRELGFDGFQEFKLALATEMAVDHRASVEDGSTDIVERLAATGATALSDTARLLDRAALKSAVDRLLSAGRIHLFGVGASAVTCHYLAYKLTRLGIHAVVGEDAHMATMLSTTADPSHVFVIVSSTGSTIDTVRVARNAREVGAFVISLTNRSRSPLASASDVVLLAAAPETPLTSGAYTSKISQLLIVDALFAGLVEARPSLAETIARTTKSVSERSY